MLTKKRMEEEFKEGIKPWQLRPEANFFMTSACLSKEDKQRYLDEWAQYDAFYDKRMLKVGKHSGK